MSCPIFPDCKENFLINPCILMKKYFLIKTHVVISKGTNVAEIYPLAQRTIMLADS